MKMAVLKAAMGLSSVALKVALTAVPMVWTLVMWEYSWAVQMGVRMDKEMAED
jgi:hypothetical protein